MSEVKKLGDYIQQVDVRNNDLAVSHLLGVSVEKRFIESIANTIGTDFSKYKIVKKRQFTYIPDTSRRGDKIGIALLTDYEEGLVSNIYTVFEITDTSKLLPEYLMLWFSRPEFDRYARYKSHGSVREIFDWEEMCRVELPVPDIKEQQKIVNTYNAITNRIQIKQKINENLEKTAQCLFEELTKDLENNHLFSEIANVTMGQSPLGDTYNENGNGMLFYQGKTDFDFRYIPEHFYTSEPTKIAKAKDILLSVRAPVGDINITEKDCCIGRGLAAINSKQNTPSFLFYTIKSLGKQFEVYNGEGTVFGSISRDGINNLKIKLPENKEIMSYENKVSSIDKQIKNNCEELNQLVKLRDLVVTQISKR